MCGNRESIYTIFEWMMLDGYIVDVIVSTSPDNEMPSHCDVTVFFILKDEEEMPQLRSAMEFIRCMLERQFDRVTVTVQLFEKRSQFTIETK